MPLLLFLSLLSLTMVAVVAVAAVLVLQSCALDLAFLDRYGDCRSTSEIAAETQLVALDASRMDLVRNIYALEDELAGLQCVATHPDPKRPLIERGWVNRADPMLYGCWDVSLNYQTRDVDDNSVASYSEWQMCFDAAGNGKEIMRDTAGVTCEGPITAEYNELGLSVVEPGNLMCSDGGYVHQRQIQCQLAEGGAAVCSTLQPETGGQADVGIARR